MTAHFAHPPVMVCSFHSEGALECAHMERRDRKEAFKGRYVVDRLQGLGPTMTSETRTYRISKNAKTSYRKRTFHLQITCTAPLITSAWSLL